MIYRHYIKESGNELTTREHNTGGALDIHAFLSANEENMNESFTDKRPPLPRSNPRTTGCLGQPMHNHKLFLNGPAGHRTNSEDQHKVQDRERRAGYIREPISSGANPGRESIYMFGTEVVPPKP